LLEVITSITPDEEVVFASRVSPSSLFYMPKDYLSHRLLIIDESNGASDATEYSIRTLQSRKKLTLAVVKRDNTGKPKTTMFDVLGPISFLDSSTSLETNPENLNRCFILQLDESNEQTERIFQEQKRKRNLDTKREDISSQIKLAKNMQRLLRPLPVVIPFIEKLNFPSHYLDSRRKFDMLLSLTETICFFHQAQRKIIQTEKGEVLEATIADYKLAYELTISIFQATFTDLDQFSHALLNEIKDTVLIQAKETNVKVEELVFNRKDILDWTNRREHELKRLLPNLERLDYLIKKAQGRGGRYSYTLNFKQITKPDLGITHPDELFGRDLVATK
jgi:DNA primase